MARSPRRGRAGVFGEMVSELLEYRELLYQITIRDLRLRYKQTVMGFGWAVFMPLVNTVIFSVIFMRVAHLQTGVPYPLFAYCGLLAWNFLASSLRFAAISLTSNANLVTKVYFPRELLPVSAVIVCLVDALVGALVLVGMMAWYGIAPTWTVLFLPLVASVQVLFTIAVALLLAMANLFYRDVKYLFEVVITVWMFATSVVYPVTMVGGRLGQLMAFNPMTGIIDGYRSALLMGTAPGLAFWCAAALSVLMLTGCWLAFHRSEPAFAESV